MEQLYSKSRDRMFTHCYATLMAAEWDMSIY